MSLDGRGFYVVRYTALPEDQFSRVTFELVDPNTGEGGSAEALVDPRLVQALNEYNSQTVPGRAFLIWINTSRNEVSWQLRKKVDPII